MLIFKDTDAFQAAVSAFLPCPLFCLFSIDSFLSMEDNPFPTFHRHLSGDEYGALLL